MKASDNPWKVPVLDVRPITHTYLSHSKDPQMAANAVSYGNEDGSEFLSQDLAQAISTEAHLVYKTNLKFAGGALFIPDCMEHKWAIFHRENKILVVRSWLRQVKVVGFVRQTENELVVESIKGNFLEDETPEMTVASFDFLIRSHVFKQEIPVPLPTGLFKEPKFAALWCMNMYGKMASFATGNEFSPDTPEIPLRSHS